MNSLALQIRLWACFKTEEKPNCFLFFLFLILCHLFQNKIVEFGKMQFNIQGIEIKYRFKDFWRYPVHNPENKNKYTVMKVIKTKKNVSKSDGLLHSNIMGDKLLLNSGAKFQRWFIISLVQLQNCYGKVWREVSSNSKQAEKLTITGVILHPWY